MTKRGFRIEAIEERLERLERQNRRLRAAAAAILLLASGALFVGAAAPSRGKTIEAEKIVLRDGAGRARAVLGVVGLGPTLAFYDEKERSRIALGVTEEGPELVFYDAKRIKRLEMEATDDEAGMDLHDGRGKRRVFLGLSKGGAPGLSLLDEGGQVLFSKP